jgi:hypothetical protein
MGIEGSLFNLKNNVIDGRDSKTYNELFFIGSSDNYKKKSDSSDSITVKASGNFYINTDPVGSKFPDILDGGDSGSNSQFIGPIIGGVSPTRKSGI